MYGWASDNELNSRKRGVWCWDLYRGEKSHSYLLSIAVLYEAAKKKEIALEKIEGNN